MDIIERLNDPEIYVDAIDDAIREIETLRERVAELEAAQQPLAPDLSPCGNHKDATITEYNDCKPWCVACHCSDL